jgi:hypothetical protein
MVSYAVDRSFGDSGRDSVSEAEDGGVFCDDRCFHAVACGIDSDCASVLGGRHGEASA